MPDLTLVFDLPAEIGLSRAATRRVEGQTADRFEREGLAYHRRIRDVFGKIAADEPARCALVDASSDPDQVAAEVWSIVSRRLGEEAAMASPDPGSR